MSYVEQICDGYNKKALMGNWYEERLYPTQPFREVQEKKVSISIYQRLGIKIKELHVSMEQGFRDHCREFREEINGKLLVGLFLTTDM